MNVIRQLLILAFILSTVSSCGKLRTCCLIEEQMLEKAKIELLFNERHQQLIQLDRWKIKGRTAIIQGTEGWNVDLKWQEDAETYQIKLIGPFAQGGAKLEGNKESVTLTLNDGKQYTALTPEELITKVIGWKLPVSALQHWVKGIPYPKTKIDFMEFDNRGRLTHLIQEQWDIELLRYIPFENYTMPAKIFIKHPELSIKLIIIDWDRP